MMKKTLFGLTNIILTLILANCGTFVVDGRLVSEIPPSPTPIVTLPDDSALVQDTPNEQGVGPRVQSSPVSFGLIEIGIILSLLVAASIVVGAFLLIRDRRPASDYPQIQESANGGKGVIQLLRFKPDAISLVLTLCAWAVVFGIIAILVTTVMFLGTKAFAEEWEPVLTHPSSILIGHVDYWIRLTPDKAACSLTTLSDESEQLLCNTWFEGALLEIDAILENKMAWYCSAYYAGEPVPCRASFDMQDNQTYVVIESDLGLSAERFQQLAQETVNTGWGEKEWIALARVIVAGISLVTLFLLWRHSGNRPDDQPSPRILFRALYAFGISVMTFAAAYYISFLTLFALKLID